MPTYEEQANKYGNQTGGALIPPNSPEVAPPVEVNTASKAPVGVLSSALAVPIIQKQQEQLASYTAPTPVKYTTDANGNLIDSNGNKVTGQANANSNYSVDNSNNSNSLNDTEATKAAQKSASEDFVTLVNADGQVQTFYNPGGNLDAIKGLMSQGYQVSKSSVSDPNVSAALSGTKPSTPSSTNSAQQGVDDAQKEVDNLTAGMNKYMISDEDLARQIEGIKQTFQARIDEMNNINQRRKQAINTTGIRLGSQYAGGSGGVFGGIVSEEERQGAMRISDLTAQMNDAITAAKKAQKDQNWTVFSKQMDLADQKRKDAVTALTAYNKALVDADAKRKDEENKQKDQLTKDITDVLTSARKNNAPTSVVNSIQDVLDSGGTVADAVNAAGDYGTDASGTVGEYYAYVRDAKANGQIPISFDDYQTRDANRKARANATYLGGLSPTLLTKATTVADQFKNEQTIQQYQTVAQGLQAFKSLSDSSADDIQRVYTFAKTMDPNSAVREGEYKTVQDFAQAVLPTFGIKIARLVDNRGFLTQEARGLMEKSLDKKFAPIEAAYNSIRDSYANRINKITGGKDGGDYLTNYTQPGLKEVVNEQDKTQNLVLDYGKNNPNEQTKIRALLTQIQPDLGRPLNYDEVAQLYGINTK